MNEKAIEFKIEVAKMNKMIKDIEEQIVIETEKKRPLNQKRYELLKAGAKKAEVLEVNKELKEVNENVLFLRDQLDAMKEVIADQKHELVKDLLEYRDQRVVEMESEMKAIQEKLELKKFEYMKEVFELYTKPLNELREELDELNQLVRQIGDGTRFKNPRVLQEKQIVGFAEPINRFSPSPFIKAEDVQKALVPNLTSNSLKLFLEYNELIKDDNEARVRYDELKRKELNK